MEIEKLEIMLELQQGLNDSTNGKGWESGVTKDGKKIDWRRSIYMEAAEMIDSYPWKHWKNIAGGVDRDNVKMESVDIWHFVLSEALRANSQNGKSIKDLSRDIASKSYFKEYLRGESRDFRDIYEEISEIEKLIAVTLCRDELERLLESFFRVAVVAELSFDELYLLYIGKNVLNKFRQDNGYLTGDYKKIWSGKEDNEALQDILAKRPQITPEELYSELEAKYSLEK